MLNFLLEGLYSSKQRFVKSDVFSWESFARICHLEGRLFLRPVGIREYNLLSSDHLR